MHALLQAPKRTVKLTSPSLQEALEKTTGRTSLNLPLVLFCGPVNRKFYPCLSSQALKVRVSDGFHSESNSALCWRGRVQPCWKRRDYFAAVVGCVCVCMSKCKLEEEVFCFSIFRNNIKDEGCAMCLHNVGKSV